MQPSLEDFWKLALASELLTPAGVVALQQRFAALKGASAQANARTLAHWLVAQGKLTRYQAAQLLAGRPGPFVLGPFTITERISGGRFNGLFRAQHRGGQRVMLVFLAQLGCEPGESARLGQLAQAAAAIKNPHVSRTHGAVKYRYPFIAVEDLAGRSLAGEQLPFAPTAACQIVFQLTLALVALHEKKIVHGAVSPANIWLDAAGAARLLQFPFTTPVDWSRRHEQLADYLAPELIEPAQQPTPQGDIYALGCTLFELLAGRVPFPGGAARQKLARQRAEFPQRLDQLNPQIPAELAELVGEMLAKDPLLRCQSASHVAHLLAPFAAGTSAGRALPPQAGRTLTPGYGAWTAPKWRAPPEQIRPEAPVELAQAIAIEPAAREPAPEIANGPEPQSPSIGEAIALAIGDRSAPSSGQEIRDEADAPFVIQDQATSSAIRPRQRRSHRGPLVAGAAGALLLVVALTGWYALTNSESTVTPVQAGKTPDAVATSTDTSQDSLTAPTEPAGPQEPEYAADDGRTPWASPTAGEPWDFRYLPGGTPVMIALRPAQLLATAEGEKLSDALGPGGKWALDWLRTTIGVELSAVETLIVGFVPDENLAPRPALVVRFAADVPPDKLLAAWQQPKPAEHAGKSYFQGSQFAYYLPEEHAGRVIAIAPPARMRELLELDGATNLPKNLERLRETTDSTRHFTLMVTPGYFESHGKDLLAGNLAKLRGSWLAMFEGSDAVALSGHLGDTLYVELRATGPVNVPAPELAKTLTSRWQAVPDQVESYVAGLSPAPYGQLIVHRLPRMLQMARDYTRAGVEGDEALLNAYLPPEAAHNLALAADLTLGESPHGASSAPTKSTPASAPSGALAALAKKISLSFPKESLDRCLEQLAQEIGLEIVILGPDLQLEGITRNQSLNEVNERDMPAGELLRKVLKLANPDGKLVYVIRAEAGKPEVLYVTTREAARKRGETLPPGF